MSLTDQIPLLHNFEPEQANFREEVLQGLKRHQKTLPCKYFYDRQGSQLFDLICDLDEYYPTRTETAIMQEHIASMAATCGSNVFLIEYGSGSSTKTRILLDHLDSVASYVPIDISREHLFLTAETLCAAYPHIDVLPVCADYTDSFHLPDSTKTFAKKVVYFPGSTIGNFHPRQALDFLRHIHVICESGGGLLIGVDLKKSIKILEPAYNDRLGVTAAFNLNILARINRELEGSFHLKKFEHFAYYNKFLGRIEMHLISTEAQSVRIGDVEIEFEEDETIHTECSYKYSLEDFAEMAASAGFVVEQVWTDPEQLFSVQYLRAV